MKGLKFTLLAFLTLLLSGCADDFEGTKGNLGSNDYLSLEIAMATPDVVQTRARNDNSDERQVTSLTFIFYKEGTVYGKEVLTSGFQFQASGDEYSASVDVPLSDNLRKNINDMRVFIVANAGNLLNAINENSDIAAVKSVVKTLAENPYRVDHSQGFLMTFDGTCNASRIEIKRLAAKLTLEDSNSTDKFTLTGFQLINAASGVKVAKEMLSGDEVYYTAQDPVNLAAGVSDLVDGKIGLYAYPTKAAEAESDNSQAFVVICGEYAGQESYYKVSLKNATTNFDVNSNTWYQMEIEKVEGPGYTSLEEAIDSSFSDGVSVLIHDHTSTVLNMVSDGKRMLGVTNGLYITDGAPQSTFVVRMAGDGFQDSDYPAITEGNINGENHKVGKDYEVEIIDGNSWMKLTKVEVDKSSVVSGADQDGSSQTPGKSWLYTVSFNTSASTGGEMNGIIKVTWAGLSREIPVTYKAEFNPTSIVTLTRLIIHGTDNSSTIECEEYWNLIAGNQTIIGGSLSKLFGVQEADMGPDKIRNQGFHFPVMYGNDAANPWWYEYQLSLFDNSTLKSHPYFSVSVRRNGRDITGSSGVWGTDKFQVLTGWGFPNSTNQIVARNQRMPVLGHNPDVIYLRIMRSSGTTSGNTYAPNGGVPDDYDYSTAELVVTLYETMDASEEGVEYAFNLYHTGFFHYFNDLSDYSKGDFSKGDYPQSRVYYYYEVVPLNGQYWLDRNVGATSSGMFIEGASGNNEGSGWPFTDGAKGGYFLPAQYEKYGKASNHLYEDIICPPGYRFPKMQEWDNIRLAHNFKTNSRTGNGTTYYNCYYQSENHEAGAIYFPKAKYYNNSTSWTKIGDDSAGYYGTATDAMGTEKEQLGQYLKSLYLSGATSSYIFGNVQNNALNIRCVAKKTPSFSLDTYNISFNVKGATNVFLYTIANGEKQPVFNWPGKGVGDYKTMQTGTINFSYASSIDYDNLYVVFAFVNKSGKILTIGSNGDVNTPVKNVKGWKVKQGATYSFDLSVSGEEVTDVTSKSATVRDGANNTSNVETEP